MSEGPQERWAPFPVQDWSTLPRDLLAPTAAPVRNRVRPWWVPLVVLLCLGLATGTGTWLARRAPGPSSPALAYVPADGDTAWQRLDTTREARTESTVEVIESARFSGINGLIGANPFFTTRALHQDYDSDPSGARVWRTITTRTDEVGGATQTTRYYRVRGSVELAGELSPEGVTAYEPALVELPADVAPGASWSSSGSVGGRHDYTSRLHAEAGQGPQAGCLLVSGELEVRLKGASLPGSRTTVRRTWCRGRGVVDTTESMGDVRTVETSVPAPAPGARDTADDPIRWTDPQRWTPQRWRTVCVDPGVADDPRPETDGVATDDMFGEVETAVHPVITRSGLVVRAMSLPEDIVAMTPKTQDGWTPAWQGHPGGTVLTMAAFGSVVVVTTSERELVAYSDQGVRLWARTLPEIGPTEAVRVSASDAVLVDLSGAVMRFALADGTVRWEHRVGSDVNQAPGVGSGVVAIGDRGGTVTALDADTGTVRWQHDAQSVRVAVAGPTVLAVVDETLVGLDLVSGRVRFLDSFDGTLTALTGVGDPAGGRTLLASKEMTLLIGPAGSVEARLPGYLALDTTADHFVGWAADHMDVLDISGRSVATWPTRPVSQVSSERPGLPTPHGVYLFALDKSWTFDSWTSGS